MTRKRVFGLSLLLIAGLLALIIMPVTCDARIATVSASTYYGGTAIDENGTLWKWGMESGIPGRYEPYIVPGMTDVKATCGTHLSTLILKNDGTVWIMDHAPYGSNYIQQVEPMRLEGVCNVTAIACNPAHDQIIAIKDDGTVWAWDPILWRLKKIDGLSDITQVAIGEFGNYAAVKKDGTVWTWGNNGNGQLGDGTYIKKLDDGMIMPGSRDTPMPVPGLTDVKAVAAGMYFVLALKNDGTVWAWGSNSGGELGDGMPEYVECDRPYPGQVIGLSDIVAISAGRSSGFALRDDGTVWAWGRNGFDASLGDGTFDDRNSPVMLKNLNGIVQISAGSAYTLALDMNGTMWAWGRNDDGQLGNLEHKVCGYESMPIKVPFSEQLSGPTIKPSWMVPLRSSNTLVLDEPAADNDSIIYLTSGDNGTLYAFTPTYLIAYDSNGNQKWNLTIPGQWMHDRVRQAAFEFAGNSSMGGGTGAKLERVTPTVAIANGHVYMYVLHNITESQWHDIDFWIDRLRANASLIIEKELIAISPDGKVDWTYPLKEDKGWYDRAYIQVSEDRVYFFHGYNETVLDLTGAVLYDIENVSDPVAVDRNGNIYAFPAIRLYWDGLYKPYTGEYADFRLPGSLLDKYDRNGNLIWSKDIGQIPSRQTFGLAERSDYQSLPLFDNEKLYVPTDSGVIALDVDGNILWSSDYQDNLYRLLDVMPFDNKGNLYLYKENLNYSMVIRSIDIDGSERSFLVRDMEGCPLKSGYDGVIFEAIPVKVDKTSISDLDTVRIGAIDARSGSYLWNYTVQAANPQRTTSNRSNADIFFKYGQGQGAWGNVATGMTINGYADADIIPTDNLVYINFRSVSYEYPIVFGKSNITYASVLYAIDRDGKIVWQKPLDSFGAAWAANNTTVFYSGDGGKINVAIIGLAAAGGIAILASAYLFLKFFLFGTVARARTRLDDNDNRKQIMQFIVASPGVTQYEIARQTGLNMGTVRYHLMILGMNHKTRTFKEGKFVRYFPNSNLFSPQEQLAISLMRREPIGGIIGTLLESPGLTYADLTRKFGLSDVAIGEHMKTLYDYGAVSREKTMDGRLAFRVTPDFAALVDGLKARNIVIFGA